MKLNNFQSVVQILHKNLPKSAIEEAGGDISRVPLIMTVTLTYECEDAKDLESGLDRVKKALGLQTGFWSGVFG